VLVDHRVPVLSDEVYEDLIYGPPFASLASLGAEMYALTIIVTAVSKSYAMTGWRIGCAAGPAEVIAAEGRLQSHSTSGANSIAQIAALAAITGDQSSVETMRLEFDRRRKYMVGRLQGMEGIVCPEPLGAFYTFPKVSAYYGRSFDGPPIETSLDFCGTLLQKAKLAVIPGGAFGADGHVRLSYAVSMQEIEEALNRLEWFLSKLE
jgi:aspartate aminotransferase